MMDASSMVVPILRKYCSPLLHVWRMIDFPDGRRYGGSSITKGLDSPFTMNLLNSFAISIDMTMPMR